ncbi:9105_t:CDS:2, partial [Scutellospora calospora]
GTNLSLQVPSVTFPTSESVLICGDQITIKFIDDGNPPTSSMSGIKVQFMTDHDKQQITLLTIAENLLTNETQTAFKVPSIKTLGYPPGKLYSLMFSDPDKPDKGGVSWSPRFTVLEAGINTIIDNFYQRSEIIDSSESPSVTTPVIKKETSNSFLLGNIPLPLPEISLLPDPQTTSSTNNEMSVAANAATLVVSTPTNTATPVVTTSANAATPAIIMTPTHDWNSVMTAMINPTMPVTVAIPLTPNKQHSPSSDPGTVIVIVNHPKTSNTQNSLQTQPSIADSQSSAINNRFVRLGESYYIIMNLGCMLIGLFFNLK